MNLDGKEAAKRPGMEMEADLKEVGGQMGLFARYQRALLNYYIEQGFTEKQALLLVSDGRPIAEAD